MLTTTDRPKFLVSPPRCGATCTQRRLEGRPQDGPCDYRVAWSINPHMHVGAAHPGHAARQHRALTQLLQRLGAEVESIPFVHGAYDSVFVKDNALLVGRHDAPAALLARPRFVERSQEQPARRRALDARGFRIEERPHAAFEGGDVVILPFGQGAVLGTGFRSDRAAAPEIAAFLGAPVTALELRDPRLYHLDTAFAALGDGTAAYCPDAFTPASRRWIERAFPAASLLRVPYADACTFALNIVEVGRHIILGGPSRWLESRLQERGWVVHVPDLAQFRLAGGSAACLVSRVHPLHVASSQTAAIRSTAA